MRLALDGEGALSRQIYRGLRSRILSGDLAPGSRLPSTRAVSAELGVSRNVVLLAYDQLRVEGYASGRSGAGTIVAPRLVAPRAKAPRSSALRLSAAAAEAVRLTERHDVRWHVEHRLPYDFRFGWSAAGDFPHETWSRLVGRRSRAAARSDLDYGHPQGRADLRQALAAYVRRSRGIDTTAERIVITSGSQQALDLVARALLRPGDRALVEEPHYFGARWAFLCAGAKLVSAPVDAAGLVLPAERSGAEPRLAYVTPSHQFPTGAVLSPERRLALLDWARRADAFVVEDDYDSEYRYEGRPLQALAGIDRDGRVVYVGTLSKVMFPGLRLGYLVLPERLLKPVTALKMITDTGSSTLEQAALAEFIEGGRFERHLRRSRVRNERRRDALVEAVANCFGKNAEVSGADGGLHVLLWIDAPPLRRGDLVEQATALGVGVFPLRAVYLRPPPRIGFVLLYSALTEAQIHEGIRRLASLFRV